jgi:hypothetical protein
LLNIIGGPDDVTTLVVTHDPAVSSQVRRTIAIRDGSDRCSFTRNWPITDEGAAVGGAFDSDTATGLMPIAHRVAGMRSFP